MNTRLSPDLLKRLPYWLFNFSGEIALIAVIVLASKFEQKMLTAWGTYLLGGLCLMRVWWFITRKIANRPTRQILRLLPAVLLLTPFPVDDIEGISWAPAVVTSVLEGMFDGGSYARAGTPVLIILGMVVALYIALELVWMFLLRPRWLQYRGGNDQKQQQLADREELLNQSQAVDS